MRPHCNSVLIVGMRVPTVPLWRETVPPLVVLTLVSASGRLVVVCLGRLLGMNSGLQLKLRLLCVVCRTCFGTLLTLMALEMTVRSLFVIGAVELGMVSVVV